MINQRNFALVTIDSERCWLAQALKYVPALDSRLPQSILFSVMIISLYSDLSVKILSLLLFSSCCPIVSAICVSHIAEKISKFPQYVYCTYYYLYANLNEVIVTSLSETGIQLLRA